MLLRVMLHRADRIVVISRRHAQELEQSYGIPQSQLYVISNGYDEADFSAAHEAPSELLEPGYFHLSHFGTVYPGFSGKFFEALASFLAESPALRSRLRVNIIGFPDDVARQSAARGDLYGVVRLYGFIGHQEAIQAMRASDCLLLFLANRAVARLSGLGKIYDYLRVGRPVLALAYEGEAQELIEEGQVGYVVNPEDTEAIKQTLRAVIKRGAAAHNPQSVRPEFLEQFRYDRLAGKLAEVLDQTVSHGK
jgi:glycosyltransferase involved in cell wall biosynthesis